MAEPDASPGQRFLLISCMNPGGHGIEDYQSSLSKQQVTLLSLLKSLTLFDDRYFFQASGLTGLMGLLFRSKSNHFHLYGSKSKHMLS